MIDTKSQSIISADGGLTWRSVEEIVALALASQLLNTGTMVGSADKGIAIYRMDTPQYVLNAALRYFRSALVLLPTSPGTLADQPANTAITSRYFSYAPTPAESRPMQLEIDQTLPWIGNISYSSDGVYIYGKDTTE